ncbi:MAG TPA: helix-turn-helix domain-containing protein [Ideonella sp.]|uniref:GlxA family transcriptional regulator n=1 Tax=Ideonella sp. TaxID=1929293 RepID=UPI002E37D74D|nr:helix-turn-helix domain-containing protein [Ideonella sp.]HEX5686489.1 helix-turn-helix domain-containing protein [Ideonella sp.]
MASDHPSTVRVGILVFPGCVRSAAVVPHDVFELANRVQSARPVRGRVAFDAVWVSARPGRSIEIDGLRFAVSPANVAQLDALIVPGVEHADAQSLSTVLAALAPEQSLLRKAARNGLHILAGCSATCLVAQSGLLDGRRATTSWWLAGFCRSHFPLVALQPEEILLQDGPFVSAAGLTSYFDLALWLVGRRAGADLRQLIARMLLLEQRSIGQTPYATTAALPGHGPVVMERAQRWLVAHVDKPWTVAALAQHCHTSERTLLRRFNEVLGCSPVKYMQQLRVDRAKRLLESTLISLEDVATRCGYQDVATLQRVFRKLAGVPLGEYRVRFGIRR